MVEFYSMELFGLIIKRLSGRELKQILAENKIGFDDLRRPLREYVWKLKIDLIHTKDKSTIFRIRGIYISEYGAHLNYGLREEIRKNKFNFNVVFR